MDDAEILKAAALAYAMKNDKITTCTDCGALTGSTGAIVGNAYLAGYHSRDREMEELRKEDYRFKALRQALVLFLKQPGNESVPSERLIKIINSARYDNYSGSVFVNVEVAHEG